MEFGFGPMSPESVEAVYRYSDSKYKPLMLIASKNQVDYNGGYVNNWNTFTYAEFTNSMRKKYQNSQVLLCRDHCGPGFNNNYDLQDTYKTIEADIESGFDLMHIDFCHAHSFNKLTLMKDAILYCQKLRPDIMLEIGTDENNGDIYDTTYLPKLSREIGYFTDFCQPKYYVVQTGSLVKQYKQCGVFNKEFLSQVSSLLHARNIGMKEHNADYLSDEQIRKRTNIVSAMNIAPQLGVVQTMCIINYATIYGISITDFVNLAHQSGKWKKWFTHENVSPLEATTVCGHYHFASDIYKKLVDKIAKSTDIEELIINTIMEVISNYENSSKTLGI